MVKVMAAMEKEVRATDSYKDDFYALMTSFYKIVVMISKDFPEFLIENHFDLLRKVPIDWVQLRNMVLCATPKNCNPPLIQTGLKIDQIKETNVAPSLSNC